jgi:hypothetical protein
MEASMTGTTEYDPASALPEGAPEPVKEAVRGNEIDGQGEKTALDWLLGPTLALEYDVPVKYETPDGMRELVFHIQQLDPDKMQEIDARNRQGDGPFAKLNVLAYNAEIVFEATRYFTDESGRHVDPRSAEFRGEMPGSPVLALQARFKKQGGILETVAERVREVTGYSPDRVGAAQRSVVDVGKH